MSWKEASLGEVAEIVSGATPKSSVSEYWGGDVAWATPTDLSRLQSKHLEGTERTITRAGLSSCSAKILPANSVLFSSRAPIGLVAINTIPVATNQGFKSFVASESLDPNFLYWWLKANRQRLEDLGTGATFKEISKRVVSEVKVPLPPIAEQHRIAAILDKADSIRRKREEALNLANELLRSAYVHIVGHLNPAQSGWQTKTIEELAEAKKGSIRSGPFGSALKHSEFVAEGIAVLGIDNAVQNRFAWADRRFITPEKYEQLKRYRVHPNDVMITIMGTTGRSAVAPEDIPLSITTKHLATITCNARLIHPEVLSYAIHSDPVIIQQIQAYNKGAIMDGLNLGIIRKLKINLPPMDEQIRFVSILKSVQNFQERSSTPEMNGSDLFASLSQRAFRAEL